MGVYSSKQHSRSSEKGDNSMPLTQLEFAIRDELRHFLADVNNWETRHGKNYPNGKAKLWFTGQDRSQRHNNGLRRTGDFLGIRPRLKQITYNYTPANEREAHWPRPKLDDPGLWSDYGEWLFDLACLICNKHVKRVLLVVECEWHVNESAIIDDFQKLILARAAECRLFIYESRHAGEFVQTLQNQINASPFASESDRYVIANLHRPPNAIGDWHITLYIARFNVNLELIEEF